MFGFDRLHCGTAEDLNAVTGCTVLIFDGGAVASVDVRGASPGTRELALLAPDKQMERVDAILMTGGSAFGLAAATGVMKFLAENKMGYQTPWQIVPIVPSAVIFDLNIGSSTAFPDEQMGYAASQAAMKDMFSRGSRGAGTGASVGKWAGIGTAMKSGQGIGITEINGIKVAAIAVVNAFGDITDESGKPVAAAMMNGKFVVNNQRESDRIKFVASLGANTTIVTVVTNAKLTKTQLNRIAQRGHDALARRIAPVHTSFDGDTVFAVSLGDIDVPLDFVSALAVDAISDAILDAVKSAESLGGLPAYSDVHKVS